MTNEVLVPPRSGRDHLGWAYWWGNEAVNAIARVVAGPPPPTELDYELEYAVRAARIAAGHFWSGRGLPPEIRFASPEEPA